MSVTSTPAVEFLQAHKVYSPNTPKQFEALKPLNLSIRKGEFFGLLGANGAGKTTAINLMSHVINISSGHVKILGIDVHDNPKLAKRHLGVVPQELLADTFFKLDVMLKIQSKISGVVPDKQWIDYLLERLRLADHRNKTTRELSGGMKRRMMIARALVHKPEILVLDEPTAGVDVELRHSMWEFIRELHKLGLTIILTTHYLEEAEQFCERLAILKKGELVTLKTNAELMQLGGQPRVVFEVTGISETDPNQHYQTLVTLAFESGIEISMVGGDLLSRRLRLEYKYTAEDLQSFDAASKKLQSFAGSHVLKVGSVSTVSPSLEEVFLQLA